VAVVDSWMSRLPLSLVRLRYPLMGERFAILAMLIGMVRASALLAGYGSAARNDLVPAFGFGRRTRLQWRRGE
jgi:hypothetical protein